MSLKNRLLNLLVCFSIERYSQFFTVFTIFTVFSMVLRGDINYSSGFFMQFSDTEIKIPMDYNVYILSNALQLIHEVSEVSMLTLD